ncbi:hypothetical protein BGZ83_011183 [Gryganskiella cystojenkinii]|nr:hypothetical protein BGZ83_011183 [Gryganskiella cystojenkinii]
MGNLSPVPNLSRKYLLRAIEQFRKYGIRVLVELHGAPGSQNGRNHSGRAGQINLIIGTTVLRTPNGPRPMSKSVGVFMRALVMRIEGQSLVYTGLSDARTASGGPGKGPWLIIHDGFLSFRAWAGFQKTADSDRLMMDTNSYIMFDDNLLRMNRPSWRFVCKTWRSDILASVEDIGPTLVGEFSVATNDCATYLSGTFGTNPRRWTQRDL